MRGACELMEQYRDHPMDLADASLVVAAEASVLQKSSHLPRGFSRLPPSWTPPYQSEDSGVRVAKRINEASVS